MPPALESTSAHKPRNKLRKLSKLRPGSTVSNSASPRASSDSPRNSNSSVSHGGRTSQSPRHALPLPPDLSDSKWLEYIRQSGYLVPMEKSPMLESTRLQPLPNTSSGGNNGNGNSSSSSSSSNNNNSSSSSRIVPEFAHLAVDVPARSPRISLERLTPHCYSDSLRSPRSPTSPTLRRQAKSPSLRAGLSECHGEAALGPGRAEKSCSVELVADQYRALLEPRSEEGLRAEGLSSRGPGGGEGGRGADGKRHDTTGTRQASVDAIRGATLRRLPVQPRSPAPVPVPVMVPHMSTMPEFWEPEGSPTSDGTLVAFEEDAIYFKPVSYSPEALSPILEDDNNHNSISNNININSNNSNNNVVVECDSAPYSPIPPYSPSYSSSSYSSSSYNQAAASPPPPPPPQPDSPSLHAAVDLLTRELTSAVGGAGPGGEEAAADVRALQVWVMIEAYEKLRYQVLGSAGGGAVVPPGEVCALRGAFDVWLGALYRMADRFENRGSSGGGGDDGGRVEVEALQMEELD